MKPFKKNLLLEQILEKPRLNLNIEEEINDYCTAFPGHLVTVVVIFMDGSTVMHKHVMYDSYNCETNCYVITTATECFVYRRELVKALKEIKE